MDEKMTKEEFVARMMADKVHHACALNSVAESVLAMMAVYVYTLPKAQRTDVKDRVDAILLREDNSIKQVICQSVDLFPPRMWAAVDAEGMVRELEQSVLSYHLGDLSDDGEDINEMLAPLLAVMDAVDAVGPIPMPSDADIEDGVVPVETTAAFQEVGRKLGLSNEETRERLTDVAKKTGLAFEGL